PSLTAWPSHVVPVGQHVHLQCHSHFGFAMFRVYKEHGSLVPKSQKVLSSKNFIMGPVTPAHAGIYRCYGSYHHSSTWSTPSDPLEIMVTGVYKKPSLLAQLGSVVMSGENVTLCCHSESSFDMYHLSRKEDAHESWLHGVQSHSGAFQADFPLGPVTPAYGGIYRCYGSFNHSPYVWSDPSDPLHLLVKENSTSCSPSPTEPSNQAGPAWGSTSRNLRSLHILIGLSVVILLLLIFVFFLIHRWCPAKKNVPIPNREPEVDGMVNREDPEVEDPQEVTYSELSHWILKQKKITPTSQRSEDTPTDSSVYVELSLR
uniref:Ig-like domain-containing protein n=1 Tax=Loxodonta africana TaxID=9785 RepID=G3TQW9_LOXAF